MKLKKIMSIVLVLLIIGIENFYSINSYALFLEECEQKMSLDLKNIMLDSNQEEDIPISIWFDNSTESETQLNTFFNILDMYGITSVEQFRALSSDKQLEIIHEFKNKNRANAKDTYARLNLQNAEKIKQYGEIDYIDPYAPVIYMTLDSATIKKITQVNDVTSVFYNDIESTEELLDISRQATRANIVQTNAVFQESGDGIRVGMIDHALPNTSRDALSSAKIVKHSLGTNDITGTHATQVAEVIVSQGSNVCAQGIAPDATLYCTYYPENTDNYIPCFTWLIDNNVDIVNISLDMTGTRNTYTAIDMLVDFYSSTYLMTFVVAAGNDGLNGVSSPGMAYNAITVGNINDKNTVSRTDDTLFPKSSYTNQSSISNIPSKPDICAPGTNINLDTVNVIGTSISAPHVTGAAALMASLDTLLLISPVSMKAVLVAGVNSTTNCYVPANRTVSTSSSSPANSYIQYGSGLLDCVRSGLLVKSEQFDFGVYSSSSTTATFSISCKANSKVRVALVFEKTTSEVESGVIDAGYNDNLNLYVYASNGSLVGASTTSNNNIEIVDFTPTSAGNYTIQIKRVTTTRPSDLRYSYAWIQD